MSLRPMRPRHPGPRRARLAGLAGLAGLIAIAWAGCARVRTGPAAPLGLHGQAATARPLAGIENAFQLGPRLWSGGEPQGDAAFADLAAHGIRTVVSVDGARPDVDAARRHGLRYVHVPIGYDGIGPEALGQLAAVGRSVPGGIFVHCHHGRHRGPAAAGVMARVAGGWDAAEGLAWLRQAGTSQDYPGLYRSVGSARCPSPAVLRRATATLQPSVAPAGLVPVMVTLDQLTEKLATMQAGGWKARPTAPDETPAQWVRLLAEQYRECDRLGVGPRTESLRQSLRDGERGALALLDALQSGTPASADAAWRSVKAHCTDCHRQHRNGRP